MPDIADSNQAAQSQEQLTADEQDIAEFMKPVQTAKSTPADYTRHVVTQDDCTSTMAQRFGHFWETIWNDTHNSDLRQKRKNEDVLLPGDVVFIPALREKTESGATEQRHRFRRKGVPVKLKLTIMGGEKPRANEPYRLELDTGDVLEGNLDGEGTLDVAVPPQAKEADLYVGKDDMKTKYELDIGRLDPVDTISGIQARLINLGFDCEEVTGKMNGETRAALEQFQQSYELDPTGQADKKTRDELEKAHGS